MQKRISKTIGLTSLGVLIGALITYAAATGFLGKLTAGDIGAARPPVVLNENIKALNQAMVAASEAVIPTVVSISVEIDRKKSSSGQIPDEFQDFFRFFGSPYGGNDDQGGQPQTGAGSGVIISSDGYIVTNNHVVEDASKITVTTNDKKEFSAKLIGTDPTTDLAVIKIEAEGLTVAHFAEMETVKVGESVIAVGNPLGLNSTVTAGIVSAIGRGGLNLPSKKTGFNIENFIQTDAAINPGNSGGGLYNLEGSLVGINSAIATRTGSYIGYGFAIPVDMVKQVAMDLIQNGKVLRAYVGIQMQNVDKTDAKAEGLSEVKGVKVAGVVKDSPAEKAGLAIGDYIYELNGKTINSTNEFQAAIALKRPGETVTLTISRDGKVITKDVKLEMRPEDAELASSTNGGAKSGGDVDADKPVAFEKLGFTVEPIKKDISEKLGVERGAYISKVDRYGNAARRGMNAGGIITKAAGEDVGSVADLSRIIKSRNAGDAFKITIKYKDFTNVVAIEIPE